MFVPSSVIFFFLSSMQSPCQHRPSASPPAQKHFRIDVRNHQYDRFYLVNYLEAGKDWKAIQDQVDDEEAFASHRWASSLSLFPYIYVHCNN